MLAGGWRAGDAVVAARLAEESVPLVAGQCTPIGKYLRSLDWLKNHMGLLARLAGWLARLDSLGGWQAGLAGGCRAGEVVLAARLAEGSVSLVAGQYTYMGKYLRSLDWLKNQKMGLLADWIGWLGCTD